MLPRNIKKKMTPSSSVLVLLIVIIGANARQIGPIASFAPTRRSVARSASNHHPTLCGSKFKSGQFQLHASVEVNDDTTTSTSTLSESQRLLSILNSEENDNNNRRELIQGAIASLESRTQINNNNDNIIEAIDESNKRFEALLGLYQVQHVLSRNQKDNPVGGKWTRSNGWVQKLFRTRNTFQHILPLNSTGLSKGGSNSIRRESHDERDSDGPIDKNISDRAIAVAEAINVISLDALDGLLRVTVILRGDAVPLTIEELNEINANRTSDVVGATENDAINDTNMQQPQQPQVAQTPSSSTSSSFLAPLSNLAVRAYFDPPRIYLGRRRRNRKGQKGASGHCNGSEYSYLPLSVGPVSSVVLDTSYCDDLLRIGVGGTSGTRFVFSRCGDANSAKASSKTATSSLEEEAKEYQVLLNQPPANKVKVLSGLGGILAISLCITFGNGGSVLSGLWNRLQNGIVFILSPIGVNGVNFSASTFAPLSTLLSKTKLPVLCKGISPWARVMMRFVAGITSLFTGFGMALISFPSGGIERDGMSPPADLS